MKNILLLVTFLLVSYSLSAETITVENTNDSGVGSLRQAVAESEEGDTIRFSSRLIANGNNTIKLTNEIFIDKGLVFKGLYNATDTLLISGENNVRIFNVQLEGAMNKVLVIDSLVLVNGYAGSGNGGAMAVGYVDSLFILNSTLAYNAANQNGGAVYFAHRPYVYVSISHSTLRHNTAGNDGAGVYSYSSASVSSVIISHSTLAHNIANDDGAAVFSYSNSSSASVSSVSISHSTLAYNTTGNDGGAVYSYSLSTSTSTSSVNIASSTLIYNMASNDGGAVYSFSTYTDSSTSSVHIINSTFTYNMAVNDGGAVYSESSSASSVNIKGSIIAFNGNSTIYNSNSPTINSMGYNLLSNGMSEGSIASDRIGVTACELKLGSLAYNGGNTLTSLPLPGSIAINAGDPSDKSSAQNSSLFGRRDIGAAETMDTTSATALTATVCDSMRSPSGKYVWTSTGTYRDTITNTAGCDSVIAIDLRVIDLITTVSIGSAQLIADEVEATYQWIDCNSNSHISGETKREFTPLESGIYAVIIEKNGCKDTTECIPFTVVGLTEESPQSIAVEIYPNPTSKQVVIAFDEEGASSYRIVVRDIRGKVMMSRTLTNKITQLDISQYESGIYMVCISNNEKQDIFKLFVK